MTSSPPKAADTLQRCDWARKDPLLAAYHDAEWGRAETDSRALWEKLILDGFQAGLSWLIVLRKRDALRNAFEGFDPTVVACYGEPEIARLLDNPAIIRSRSKINAAIVNARAYLAMQQHGEDFATFAWSHVGGQTLREPRRDASEVPASTPGSKRLSQALKQRGFKFVGPIIVYAWMQACGLVDDHIQGCHCCATPRRATP